VALVAATLVATGGLYGRIASYNANADLRASAPTVIKAGEPMQSATRDGVVVR